ncbi:PilT/PilU family type 4a pilus ATPase [Tichowtungia aerotolerans]|uniref:PilT/PilU family type 4a pilus ATPase n=1 Tax=Tichowtungia aerotolerans TaxID=2697043 RepID=A0A6P1MED1_9BACT|nr:PilT/PilU family type 4a pilus ATPase [Tichowtungia aerotolerans]
MDKLLEIAIDKGASDLHISSGYSPCIRVDGTMQFLSDYPALISEDNDAILQEIMPERNLREFEQSWDTDFGYEIEDTGRFRVNAFKDSQGTGAVFRTIPTKVPTIEELGLSFAGTLRELCMHTKGLIIVTGPTGSGKSTTLAAMVDLINRTRSEHIITIEDPIEFSHNSKGCLINQREVHRHTRSFSGALRAALREDPDIVLLGEMRDLETTEIALETAETGHLVLATLHTNTATSTVDRIIDKFPSGRQNQIRTLLANTLTAVIAQTLCKRMDGGRAAAAEMLIATSAVRAMIRDEKTHQLPTAIQVGHNVGMRSFTDSLYNLVADGIINPREAYLKAVDKLSIEQKFEEKGITVDKTLAEIPRAEVLSEEISTEDMNSPEFLKEQAWLLATDRNSQARDGGKALEFAQRAIDLSEKDAESLMILAAAQAETGDFREAVDNVKKAIQMAKSERNSEQLSELKAQLVFYKKGQPHPGAVA